LAWAPQASQGLEVQLKGIASLRLHLDGRVVTEGQREHAGEIVVLVDLLQHPQFLHGLPLQLLRQGYIHEGYIPLVHPLVLGCMKIKVRDMRRFTR